jgi:hypothetical protein
MGAGGGGRLARARDDGTLDPWVEMDGPPWKSWALSEVSVSAFRVPAGSVPAPGFADAVGRLRSGWGRFEQEVPVAVLSCDGAGVWGATLQAPDGKPICITYANVDGLGFSSPERRASAGLSDPPTTLRR